MRKTQIVFCILLCIVVGVSTATALRQNTPVMGSQIIAAVDSSGNPARVVVDGSGYLYVNAASTLATVIQGTAGASAWLVTGTGGTFPATQSGTWTARLQDGSGNAITSTTSALDVNIKSGVTVDVAHGAADSGNPAKIGMRAVSSEITPITTAYRSDAIGTLSGGLLVQPESLPQDQWQGSGAGTAKEDTNYTSVITHTDDYYTDVTSILVTNSDAAVGTVVQVSMGTGTLCGTGTAILFEGYAASGGGGFALGNGQGVLFSTTAVANDICIKCVTTSAEVHWSMKGFKSKLKRN